jgi:hypothetical protein
MSCGGESPADSGKIGRIQGIVGREGKVGDAVDLGYILSGQVKLTLKIDLGNRDIAQGHTDIRQGLIPRVAYTTRRLS